jgi:hypothetical protein
MSSWLSKRAKVKPAERGREYSIEDAEGIYAHIPPSTPRTRQAKRMELGRMAFKIYPPDIKDISTPLDPFATIDNNAGRREAWLIEILEYYGLIENYADDVAELKRMARNVPRVVPPKWKG